MTCRISNTEEYHAIMFLGEVDRRCIPELPCHRVIPMPADLRSVSVERSSKTIRLVSHKVICFGPGG